MRLPSELIEASSSFEKKYLASHSGRRLTWLPSVSHCIVRGFFAAGRKEFDVSLSQALVLLLFNSAETLTAGDIRVATGLESDELTRTLQSLALGQVRVLKKEPKGRDVADSDAFTVNTAFTHNLVRVKINQIQIKETKAEADETNEKVAQDRLFVIDATIVRIMKTRKTLAHQALMGELLAQLRFATTTADIKKRIASLIDREYIARDGDGGAAGYSYLA